MKQRPEVGTDLLHWKSKERRDYWIVIPALIFGCALGAYADKIYELAPEIWEKAWN